MGGFGNFQSRGTARAPIGRSNGVTGCRETPPEGGVPIGRLKSDKSVIAIKIHTKDNLANALTKQEPGFDASAAQLRLIAGPRTASD